MQKIMKKMSSGGVVIIVLTILIAAQVFNLIHCFFNEKKGYHSDEMYTYGYANGYDMTFLSNAGLPNNERINDNEWISGDLFLEYLSVEEDERFAYMSIIRNERGVHPPLYFILLHTISSFFPGKFSWWFGFSINLVLFVLTQIFLFLFVRRLAKSSFIGILLCLLYGFSQGGINTFIYIRMYSILTFFCVLTMYFHLRLYEEEEKFGRNLKLVFVATLFGFLTHLYFAVFAGVLSACFCVYYLIKKNYKRMFQYGISELFALAGFLIIHPYVLNEFFAITEKTEQVSRYAGFGFEFRSLCRLAYCELTGMKLTLTLIDVGIFFFVLGIVLLGIAIPAAFLLRNEKWFREFVKKIPKKMKGYIAYLKTRVNLLIVCAVVIITATLVVIAKTTYVYAMGTPVTRYVFNLYPFCFVILILVVKVITKLLIKVLTNVIKRIKQKSEVIGRTDWCVKIVLVIVSVALLVNIYYKAPRSFYYQSDYYGVDVQVQDLPRDASYILALKEYWLIDWLALSLCGVESFYATTQDDLLMQTEMLEKFEGKGDVYLLLAVPSWKDMIGSQESQMSEDVIMDESFYQMVDEAMNNENELTQEFLKTYEEYVDGLSFSEEFTFVGLTQVFARKAFVFKIR